MLQRRMVFDQFPSADHRTIRRDLGGQHLGTARFLSSHRPLRALLQGIIGTRQLQEAVSGLLFCDVLSHSAELFGTPSKVLGMSEMIHLFSACAFSACAQNKRWTVRERSVLIHIKNV
jgi:hypothetical protein